MLINVYFMLLMVVKSYVALAVCYVALAEKFPCMMSALKMEIVQPPS